MMRILTYEANYYLFDMTLISNSLNCKIFSCSKLLELDRSSIFLFILDFCEIEA